GINDDFLGIAVRSGELMGQRIAIFVALDRGIQRIDRDALLAAAKVNHPVGDDSEQPPFKGSGAVVTRKVVPGAQIGILGHIFRIGGIAREAVGQIIGAALAPQIQTLELLLRRKSGRNGVHVGSWSLVTRCKSGTLLSACPYCSFSSIRLVIALRMA